MKQVENNKDFNPDDLNDRETYMTEIGPVCMSRFEHEQYLEKLEERNLVHRDAEN